MELTNTNLAYFAGILDADGTICISKVNRRRDAGYIKGYLYSLHVAVGSIHEWLPFTLQNAFGGNVHQDNHKNRFINAKPFFVWQTSDPGAAYFLDTIIDYLHLKKPQAEIAIAFQSKKHHRAGTGKSDAAWALEEAQCHLVKSLNAKGGGR